MTGKQKTRIDQPAVGRAKHRALPGGRRGRPTSADVRAINEAIIETARRQFLSDGYDKTAMEAIARRAGVSKKTLYDRFPTKPELFSAIVEAQVAAWSARARRDDDALGSTLRERLEHHAEKFLEAGVEPEVRAFERMLLGGARHFPELGRIYYKTAIQFALDLIEKEISTAAKHDRVPVSDAGEAARMFMESLTGWSSVQSLLGNEPSPAQRRRVARFRVAVFMEGRAAW
jgi:AcrR family transcriptional regulator